MMEQELKDRQWYYDELMSEQCLCERKKKKKYSFCWKCYSSLPPDMKQALYYTLGFGYEDAFEAAVKYLEENVW